jgi:hypothetical protein
MARDHVIDPSAVHHQWDSGLEPILAIGSGDTVHYDLKVAGEGQVWPGARYEDTSFDFDTIYNLSGPLWVNGAEPGGCATGTSRIGSHTSFIEERGLYLRTLGDFLGRVEAARD